jgi:hypothetical protein
MKRSFRVFGFALICCGMAAATTHAKEFPFYATNNSDLSFCLLALGPWARESGYPNLAAPAPGTNRWNWYTAEGTLFSPVGSWTFEYYKGHYDGRDCVPDAFENNISGSIEFCLQSSQTEIDLTINPDYSAAVNAPAPPCSDSLTATADLGHEAGPEPRLEEQSPTADRDTFAFEGDAGEAVMVNLTWDGSAGHTGDLAVLRLLLQGRVIAEADGALPLTLDTTLPEAGEYHVVVLEQRSSRAGFRGRYILSVLPDAGSDDRLLEPQSDAEHF